MNDIKIAPSILSADFGKLLDDVLAVESAGADLLHIDVMDGHFVQNITIGPVVLKSLQGKTKLPFDVHLMITDPDQYAPAFAQAGAQIISIHAETCANLAESIAKLKKLKVRPAIVLNPDTPITLLEPVNEQIDMVLIMSVFPGFAGQKFIPEVLPKISQLRALHPDWDIEVDGGINPETAQLVIKAGANILVAGSALFGSANYQETITKLKK